MDVVSPGRGCGEVARLRGGVSSTCQPGARRRMRPLGSATLGERAIPGASRGRLQPAECLDDASAEAGREAARAGTHPRTKPPIGADPRSESGYCAGQSRDAAALATRADSSGTSGRPRRPPAPASATRPADAAARAGTERSRRQTTPRAPRRANGRRRRPMERLRARKAGVGRRRGLGCRDSWAASPPPGGHSSAGHTRS
jgi:hypothetical protein